MARDDTRPWDGTEGIRAELGEFEVDGKLGVILFDVGTMAVMGQTLKMSLKLSQKLFNHFFSFFVECVSDGSIGESMEGLRERVSWTLEGN